MKNVHVSLTELVEAQKHRLSLKHQFQIYRQRRVIEFDLWQEHEENYEIYPELIYVNKFEELFVELQDKIS